MVDVVEFSFVEKAFELVKFPNVAPDEVVMFTVREIARQHFMAPGRELANQTGADKAPPARDQDSVCFHGSQPSGVIFAAVPRQSRFNIRTATVLRNPDEEG